MQVWEYSTVQSWKEGMGFQWSSGVAELLKTMGEQGWELVTTVETQRNMVEWIFKRPKAAAPAVHEIELLERVA